MSRRSWFQDATTERHIWHCLSSFGIMYALLSFLQENLGTGCAVFDFAGTASKGILAFVGGGVLFLCLPLRMDMVKQDAHVFV